VLEGQLVVVVAAREVDVTVEQAGQERLPRAVDPLVAVEAGADLDDPTVLDHDVALA